MEYLKIFKEISGRSMNVEKTQAIWLGSKSGTADVLCPELHLNWVTNFKLLGFNFDVNLEDTLDLNYNYKLLEIQNVLKPYAKRNLSRIGKVSVIKTFAVPKLIHVLTALPAPPGHIMKQLEPVLKNISLG